MIGAALADCGVPIADTAAALWAPGRTLLLTACVSMTGFLLGNLFGTSRLVFALGRDGYLPRACGRVTARHRVPLVALIVHAGFAWVLALGGSFDTLALISGGAICLTYGMASLAAWRAQRIDLRERGEPFVMPGGPVIPLVSFVAMAAIVTTLKYEEWRAIGIALAVVYVGLRIRAPAR
jgi:amino acid transporter